MDPAAYESYLKGKFYLNQFTPEGFRKGMLYLQQAIEKDSTEPLFYAGLALGYSLIGHEAMPDAFQRARAAALQASQRGEMLAETHEALAESNLYSAWDWAGAKGNFERALALNPSLPEAHAHYAWYLQLVGQNDQALAEMVRAKEVDPLSPLWPSWRGWLFMWNQQYDSALAEARESLELNPDFPWGHYVLGVILAEQGEYQPAIAAHRRAAAATPALPWSLGYTYALAGSGAEARTIAAGLKQDVTPMNAWGLAEIYGVLGEKEEAFRWLEQAYRTRFSWMPWMEQERALAPLKHDPRFEAMVRRLQLPPR